MKPRLLPAIAVLLFTSCPVWGREALVDLQAQRGVDQDLVTVELSTVGFDQVAGAPVVLLRDPESGKVLPIWVGAAEAQAIAFALHGIAVPRPMTHDLMANLLSELRAEVEEVVVRELRGNTYIGSVRLRAAGEDKIRDVDSRPSDALALALRTDAPIRVARKVLAAAPTYNFTPPEGSSQVVQALGVTVVAATPALRDEFKLGKEAGVVVTGVFGPARDKGLRRGDLIVAVNGAPALEPMAFFEAVRAAPAGKPIRITYLHAGVKHDIDLPADVPPRQPQPGRSRVATRTV